MHVERRNFWANKQVICTSYIWIPIDKLGKSYFSPMKQFQNDMLYQFSEMALGLISIHLAYSVFSSGISAWDSNDLRDLESSSVIQLEYQVLMDINFTNIIYV